MIVLGFFHNYLPSTEGYNLSQGQMQPRSTSTAPDPLGRYPSLWRRNLGVEHCLLDCSIPLFEKHPAFWNHCHVYV